MTLASFVGGAVMIYALCVWTLQLLRYLGEQDFIFSKYEENRTKYVKRGGQLEDAFTSTEGKVINAQWKLIAGNGRTSAKDRWCPIRFFGLYGPMWPWIETIHDYQFIWNSPIKELDDSTRKKRDDAIEAEEQKKLRNEPGHTLRHKIRYHRSERIKSFYSNYTYPILIEDVELADGTKIDILMWITANADDVLWPIFGLNGEWFPLIESAIIGIVTKWCAPFNYAQFEKVKKDCEVLKGDLRIKKDSDKKEDKDEEALLACRDGEPLDPPMQGLQQTVQDFLVNPLKNPTKIKFSNVIFSEYDLSYDPQGAIEEAQRLERVAIETAKATRRASEGKRDAKIIEADGEKYAIEQVGMAEARVAAEKYKATGSSTEVEKIKALPKTLQVLGGNALISLQSSQSEARKPEDTTASDTTAKKTRKGTPS